MSLNSVIAGINKKYGAGALVVGANARGLSINRIRSGSLTVDIATGGGWAQGKINEIYGPLCLDGDSIVNYHIPTWKEKRGKARKRPITIAELFKVNSKKDYIYLESIDETSNVVTLNRVVDVVCSGIKPLYKVTTEHGFTLNSTLEHAYKTREGYEQLKNLSVGDTIAVTDARKSFNKPKERIKKEIHVKWHPTVEPRIHSLITGTLGGQGIRGGKYVRLYEHRLVYEASMNNLSTKDYIRVLNNYDGRNLVTIPKGYDIHHKNGDYTDNELSNLVLLSQEEHAKLHPRRGQASKTLLWDTIVSIEYVCDKVTYDISMEATNNNFIANNIVVHNSGGKSYLWQLTMAQIQKDYPNSTNALIDFEGSFDNDWARAIGIDTSKLLISSPEYMEDGLNIAIELIKSGDVFSVVIDSLAAACPKAEYEGDMADFTVGLRARLGNKFVRKSKPKSNLLAEEMDLGQTTLFIINQTYTNVGGYGSPEITPGGQQVRYGAMLRMNIRKGEVLKDSSDGTCLMQESKFTVTKNKTAPPNKTGSFWFSTKDNNKGEKGKIYRAGEIVTYGVITGVISRSGAWYSLPEEFGLEKALQGESAVSNWIEENPDKFPRLEEIILSEIPKLKG